MFLHSVITFAAIAITGVTVQAQTLVPGNWKVVEIPKSDQPNAVAFELTGTIAYPLAMVFEEEIARIPADKVIYLNLDSYGGSLDEGLKIIETIKKEKEKGRKFVSIVTNGQRCASMCVPIYVQAQERRAYEVSAFMFHGTHHGGITNIPDPIRTRALLSIFTDAGVAQAFLDDLWAKGAFTGPGEYWLSGREIWDAKSGVVTKLHSRHKKYKPYRAPIDPNIRPR